MGAVGLLGPEEPARHRQSQDLRRHARARDLLSHEPVRRRLPRAPGRPPTRRASRPATTRPATGTAGPRRRELQPSDLEPRKSPAATPPSPARWACPRRSTAFERRFSSTTATCSRRVKAAGFWYDCSIQEGTDLDQDGTNFFWPYTLDQGSPGHATDDRLVPIAHLARRPVGDAGLPRADPRRRRRRQVRPAARAAGAAGRPEAHLQRSQSRRSPGWTTTSGTTG